MKKKTIMAAFVALNLFGAASAQQLQNYDVKGTVTPTPKDLVIHMYYRPSDKPLQHDSARVINGKFEFKGTVPSPTISFMIFLKDGEHLNQYMSQHMGLPKEQVGVYLEQGTVNLAFDENNFEGVKTSGTFNNDAVQSARPLIWKYKNEEDQLTNRLGTTQENDTATRNKIMGEYTDLVKRRTIAVGQYIKKNPKALASLDLLKRWVSPTDELEKAKLYYSYMDASLQSSPSALIYKSALDKASQLTINSQAPDFKMKDTSGVSHSLADYRGKYVLLDFWASWCGPCLEEMPNVVNAYNQFKDKDFQIVGVSLDGGSGNSHDRWTSAIVKNKMAWPQLSDLAGWNTPAAHQYLVNAIPMNFLIDPNGKIIAKNLRGDELISTLHKYLN